MQTRILIVFVTAFAAGLFASSCGSTRGDCDSSNCSSGCCDSNGECQPGFLNDACGMGGVACVACGAGTACGSGACIPFGSSCLGTGASCTANSACCTRSCVGGLCSQVVDGGQNADAGVDAGTDAGVPTCDNISGDRATQVCLRWKCDRADRNEGAWSGATSGCVPGDNVVNRQNALKLLNLQRFLAGLPEVTTDPTRDQKAQECALMMHANGQLNHSPPTTWTCYSANGAEAAGRSNLSTTPGVSGVDLYMLDPGNATTMGHRRWILSPALGPVGLGSTSSYSCMWVIGGSGSATRPYVAWPAPGPFPLQAFNVSFGSINSTGWTVQSNTLNLAGATVTVTDNGTSLPVTVNQLASGYGSTYAISFIPQGWVAEAGHSYSVSLTGIPTPITYTVDVVSCL